MSLRVMDGLDRLLREEIGGDRPIAGAVVLVRHGNEVLFHEAYGFRQRVPRRLPMTRETLFDVASLTKPICTGLVAMQLVRRGLLGLDDVLEKRIPWPVKDPAKRGITLRQLLCNRAGLPAWRPFYVAYGPESCPVPADELAGRVLGEPLEGPPGEREVYSDLGFLVAGWILEHAGGASLDRLFRDEIADPLGLGRTGFRPVVEKGGGGTHRTGEDLAATEYCCWRRRILVGEVHDENAYLVGGVSGHAGLFSSAGELDRIVAEIFRGLRAGRGEGLFSGDFLETFFQRQDPGGPGTWALGWDTPSPRDSTSGRYFSRKSVGHNGFTGTSLWIDLDREISVVFLTNRVHPTRRNDAIRALRPRVHDQVLSAWMGKKG